MRENFRKGNEGVVKIVEIEKQERKSKVPSMTTVRIKMAEMGFGD